MTLIVVVAIVFGYLALLLSIVLMLVAMLRLQKTFHNDISIMTEMLATLKRIEEIEKSRDK
jgi:hypothetical protein